MNKVDLGILQLGRYAGDRERELADRARGASSYGEVRGKVVMEAMS
jgi:hypothetical protein